MRLHAMMRARPVWMASSLLAAGSCHAGTSSPIDLGPLLAVAALYFLGLIVCLIMSVVSKRTGFWLSMVAAGIGLPVAVFFVGGAITSHSQARRNEEIRQGTMKNLVAFQAYCTERQRSVSARVPVEPGTALLVQVENGFPLGSVPFNASPLRGYMMREPSGIRGRKWCERSGIGSLVGRYDRELRQFDMCSDENGTPFTGGLPRYALILGDTMDATPAPWLGKQIWMYKSRIRLIDRNSGATLAKDTMYFLRYDEHGPGCPDGNEQIASLIAEVFPKQ